MPSTASRKSAVREPFHSVKLKEISEMHPGMQRILELIEKRFPDFGWPAGCDTPQQRAAVVAEILPLDSRSETLTENQEWCLRCATGYYPQDRNPFAGEASPRPHTHREIVELTPYATVEPTVSVAIKTALGKIRKRIEGDEKSVVIPKTEEYKIKWLVEYVLPPELRVGVFGKPEEIGIKDIRKVGWHPVLVDASARFEAALNSDVLTERDRIVLQLRSGLYTPGTIIPEETESVSRSLEEVGKVPAFVSMCDLEQSRIHRKHRDEEESITRERVRQLEERALEKVVPHLYAGLDEMMGCSQNAV